MPSNTDGRDTRWEAHRTQRRGALVEDTLRAIRSHGAGVGMDEIAARAGTSKTVIYRHFGDRAGLYAAVVEKVHDYIHADLQAALALAAPGGLATLAHDLADAYLSLVERDPEIYRFVMSPPPTPAGRLDPLGGLPEVIGDHVAEAVAAHLRAFDRDASCASTWGHGLVGFVQAVADRWMATGQAEPKHQVVAHVDSFVGPALAGLDHHPQLQEQR
jgi:AcrR family transcriptional regulator